MLLQTKTVLFLASILLLVAILQGCTKELDGKEKSPLAQEAYAEKVYYSDDGNEPPINKYLADSPWPMSHRNPYCQASSPYEGPKKKIERKKLETLQGMPGLITIAISGKYPDGSRVLWGSNIRSVFKARYKDGELNYIDSVQKADYKLFDLLNPDIGISGAYTLIDKNGDFFLPKLTKIYAYGDAESGKAGSPIALKGVFEIPASKLKKTKEDEVRIINGITLTYDGMIAVTTNGGLLCLVSRNFDKAVYFRFGENEEISNSLACDEDGGIYVVTSQKMYRVQWTGEKLSTDEKDGGWSADYEIGENIEGVRLGLGSGSTPTLMGTGNQDKFVVITDGQELMHLVLFWRDKIPANWKKIPGSKDRRIAAQVPVTFGNASATKTLSEQSVCVRGYGALVVNNQLKTDSKNRIFSILRSGDPEIAPYGAEKFVWDPGTKKLASAWVNKEVSLPNGIPTMSAASGLIYDIGQRAGIWTFEALDWKTGISVFSYPVGNTVRYNSTWAATEIGHGKTLYSGAALGVLRVEP
ncbi:MAG: hypothetical protein GY754_45305 [bacterium]|nr:hypothetical protein [bacterium]